MTDHRLKIKIGEHEFEASGSVETVQSQFETFAELIKTMASISKEKEDEEKPPSNDPNSNQLTLDKIMRTDGRVVSLTIQAAVREAILLIMLGQREFRSNELSAGTEIMDGLRQSGHGAVGRIDGTLNRLSAEGLVITTGEHRGRRYRLTNTGIAAARQIAEEMIATVP